MCLINSSCVCYYIYLYVNIYNCHIFLFPTSVYLHQVNIIASHYAVSLCGLSDLFKYIYQLQDENKDWENIVCCSPVLEAWARWEPELKYSGKYFR
jgi:hypothetical protein